ncbi:MAG: DUF3098 domain-containing protein [Flavobacteriaceae bacterium]|jgi:uncharacterized membrane protein|nr:DUF3098 domain-containing protein [Flavobacteriaceae bacterium]
MKKQTKNLTSTSSEKHFLFGKKNYIFMLIGLALIALGLILMTGDDANTIDGVYNPNRWNDGIFSFRRVRLAPLLIVLGFVIEVYAILVNPEKEN